ncbi:globin domain-containing protein [Streptomyces sp. ST2-7A]|uniref:globin domain-containing protein n=1 Tax=Streptomyces sp. ST2-7A TaxID=2907214 RepID=UPI001F44A292|nr:globin domain-containing protein [Streptomyces sp. ST2-7A]MCE7081630.1 globin domain-containing protein [Streptomyces sp. ST2-7A]
MLSERSTPIVRATLPAVGAALDRITDRFYRRMFEARPDLLRDLFNRGNQANGEQRRALAGSVAAFAGMLVEHPDRRPDTMLRRIAHKHVSLGITAEQYDIVHHHLMSAIGETLGEAVTPEVAAAWDEVYWLMARALIALEADLYREAGTTAGEVWGRMEVVDRRRETEDVVTLALRPTDDRSLPPFRPGQYVGIRVELPDGARQIRQYSLIGPANGSERRISVKRVRGTEGTGGAGTPDGEVSHLLHDRARVGDVLDVTLPFGDLPLPGGEGPILLASAGIGITPLLAVLEHLAATGSDRPVLVAHADRSPIDHAHRELQRELVDKLPNASLRVWYERTADGAPGDPIDPTELELPPHPSAPTAWLCGPLPFMRAVRNDLLERGVPAAGVHYEVFGPDLWIADH